MRVLARLRRLAGVIMLLALASVQSAWAHAQLLSAAPPDGAVLQEAPEVVALLFNEPVNPLAVSLIGPDANSTDLTGRATGGTTVTVSLPDSVPPGTHVLSWRVVSADGHPVAGSLVFSIGKITGAVIEHAAGNRPVLVALWASKILLFIGLFAGVGGALFMTAAGLPKGARQAALVFSAVGLVAALLSLGLQGLDALGLPLSSLADSRTWSAGLSTSYGATAICIAAAFGLSIAALLMARWRMAGFLGMAAGGLGALSLALSGHAAAAAPQWLTRPAVFLHVGGILFWVGALPPLWLLLRNRSNAADTALASFSNVIPLAVVPLVLSGITLAVIQMGFPGPSWLSPYGALLAIKLGLLVVLFALALWNRRWLTAPVLAGDPKARYRLRRSIGLEMLIIVVILAVVAGWRFTPPPRALAVNTAQAAAAEPLLIHLTDTTTMAMITVTPGSTGPVTMTIYVTGPETTPIAVQGVDVSISAPQFGIEPLRRKALAVDGAWRVDNLIIPVAGDWQITLDIRVSRFDLVTLEGGFTIP